MFERFTPDRRSRVLLVVAYLAVAPACVWGVPESDGADGSGLDASGGSLELTLGRPAGGGDAFEAYTVPGAEIDLVHGFQGGYHVEPSLYLTGVDEAPTTDIEYVVERRPGDEQLNRPTSYEIVAGGWAEYEDGYIHHSNPVIFEIDEPSEVVGDPVQMEVTVGVDGVGQTTASVNGRIVDPDGM